MISSVQEEVSNPLPKISGGWQLFDPSDVYETEDLSVFEHFLNSKGTVEVELANMKTKTFTLLVRGNITEDNNEETACVLYHGELPKLSRPRKIALAEMVYALPGVGSIARNRLGSTLAEYFGVTKETSR